MNAFTVGYVPCVTPSADFAQQIYSAYRERIQLYLSCIQADIIRCQSELIADVSIQMLVDKTSKLELHTYSFICALLTGKKGKLVAITRNTALGILNDKHISKPYVFFQDEFPVHSLRSTEPDVIKFRLRFMRNVVGALGIVNIISSTHSSAMNMHTQGNDASRGGGQDSKLWCYVVPRFPKFEVPNGVSSLPAWFEYILTNSRPWFSHIALQHFLNHRDADSIHEYLDRMCLSVWENVKRSKKFGLEAFLHGQVCLLLSVNHIDTDNSNTEYNVIEKHFAQLDCDKMFRLWLTIDGLCTKNKDKWIHRVLFPNAKDDFLLHLVFMGGKGFRAFNDSFAEAVQATKKHQTFSLCFENSSVKTNDGLEAEAIRLGAAVLASRHNGIQGMNAANWIGKFMVELQLVDQNSTLTVPGDVSEILSSVRIPYLGAPNVGWPNELPEEFNRLGNFSRTLNRERVDGKIGSSVSFEVKDRIASFNTKHLEDAFERKPDESQIHIILVNSVVKEFYSVRKKASKLLNSYDRFVARHQSLAQTYVYKLTSDGYKELGGITNKCRCIADDHSNCKPSSVIILIPNAS